MFSIRTVFPEEKRVELASYDLTPGNDQGKAVCDLFREFLSNRPTEFRDKLAFITKGDFELEWAAAEGGIAMASFFSEGNPLSTGMLLTGVDPDTEEQVLYSMRTSVLGPVLGEETERLTEAPERPLLLSIVFPGHPELFPTVQLLYAALASVFFRVILQLQKDLSAAPS
jgi:hypothetical protein